METWRTYFGRWKIEVSITVWLTLSLATIKRDFVFGSPSSALSTAASLKHTPHPSGSRDHCALIEIVLPVLLFCTRCFSSTFDCAENDISIVSLLSPQGACGLVNLCCGGKYIMVSTFEVDMV